jgi:hypothetical protein
LTSGDDSTVDVLTVAQHDSGRVVRQDLFSVDRLDDARRCYEEMMNPGARQGSRVVSNAASRAFEAAWAAAINERDPDRFVALLHPGYVHQPHQRIQVHDVFGADEAVEIARGLIEGRASVTTETLAIRGDDVACGRWSATFGPDIVELLAVTVVDDDGLIVSAETFEPEDLHDALDRVDQIQVERRGASSFLELMGRLRRVAADGDRDAAREFLAPGWTSHDERPLGLGVLDREEFLRSSVRADHAYIVMEVIEDTGSVAFTHDRWVAPNGSQWEHLAVMTYSAGLNEVIELFALDDLATAEARVAELVAAETTGAVGTFGNAAWRVTLALNEALVDGDRQRYVELLATDFVSVPRYRLNIGRELGPEDFADAMSAQRTMGETFRAETELVAVRGDDLCLVRFALFVDDNVQPYLGVLRAAGGRIAQLTMYDDTQLAEALQDLDAQWARETDPKPELTNRAWEITQLVYVDLTDEGFIDRYSDLHHPDFVSVDHERFTLEPGKQIGREEYVASVFDK